MNRARMPEQAPSRASADELHSLAAEAAHEARLPGLAFCVIADGAPLLSGGLGRRDVQQSDPVDADTRFPIASCTKPLTAELILGLANQGLLDLDTPVRTPWPGYTLADPATTARLTPRDLLCHRQPLAPHPWAWIFCKLERARFFAERVPHLQFDPKASPGTHLYSNIQYAALGQLFEIVTDQSWEDGLANRLLSPLGMDRSAVAGSDWAFADPNTAQPHALGAEGPFPIPPFHARLGHPIAPASELLSSARDLGRWLGHQLACPRILPAEMLVSDRHRHPALGPLHYSLGWRTEIFHDHPHHWHSGQCTGYSALTSLRPDSGIGIALLANTDGALPVLHRLAYTLLDRLEGRPAESWAEVFPTPRPHPAAAPSQTHPLDAEQHAQWLGAWHHPGYGTFAIVEHEQGLSATLQGSPPGHLAADNEGRIRWHPPGYRIAIPVDLAVNPLRLSIAFPSAPRPLVFAP